MNGSRSRRKGDDYERTVVKHLNTLGLQVRRAKRGNDTGDILGAPKLVIECKNAVRFQLSAWLDQMQAEKNSARAPYGALIVKRPGKRNVAEHYFLMTVEDGLLLLQQANVIEAASDGAQ